PSITEDYHLRLSRFRKQFSTSLSSNEPVPQFQNRCDKAFQELVKTFLTDAFTILGPPPCAYDFRVLGSAGRKEFCPFSDLEFNILYGPKTEFNQNYFADLIWLLDFQIRSLGETASADLAFVFKDSPHSLQLDLGGNFLDHIKTPQEMAQLQFIFHPHVE